METSPIRITPKIAATYLSMNTHNRVIRPSNIDLFVALLERGEFLLTHQGIAISKDGVLLDGQHRLLAIVKSGISAWIQVTTNCDPSLYQAIDGGRPRNTHDLTSISPRTIQVINVLQTVYGFRQKRTPGAMNDLYEIVGRESDELLRYAPSNKKFFSAAPVRSAAVVLIKEGFGEEAMNLYRKITLLDFDNLPSSTKAFSKQVITQGTCAGGRDQISLFCRALKALDQRTNNSRGCNFTDEMKDDAAKRLENIFGEKPKPTKQSNKFIITTTKENNGIRQ